jgi:hypothetical protein
VRLVVILALLASRGGRGRKRKRRQKADKKAKRAPKRRPRLSDEDRKVVVRIWVEDFEIYAHSKTKGKFWAAIWQKLLVESGKNHATLDKAIRRWEKEKRRVLQLIREGKYSGEEEDDREFLIAIDEWISLVDSLKERQKAKEARIGKADSETLESKRIQENLGR